MKLVAQQCMDDYEQNYASGVSFFTIDDYINRVGDVAADIYRQMWDVLRQEFRQEKRQEIPSFDPSTLSEQVIKLEKENGAQRWTGDISSPYMSLPYDEQTSGIQLVFDEKTGKELERSNLNATWEFQYYPFTDRFFFSASKTKINVFTKGNCNIQSLRVLYVPSIGRDSGDAEVPDGIVALVKTGVVNRMRELAGRPIKKALDGNQNEKFETEFNKKSLETQ